MKKDHRNSARKVEDISQDKLLKTAFELFFRDLVELVVPELAATWNLETIKLGSDKLFTDLRKRGHVVPDLIAEVATLGGSQIVVVHVEIEGTFRKAFDLRMWCYYMHLRLQTKKSIVPIVVFLHGGPAGIEWREVVDWVDSIEIARFRYLAFGLSRSQASEYLARPQPLAAALAARMRRGKWDKVEHKLRCLQAIGEAKNLDVDHQYILGKIVETSVRLDEEEEQRFYDELRKDANKEVQEMAITWQEALAESKATGWAEGKAQGWMEGRQEGEAKGRLEGEVYAAHLAVLIAARGRFGTVPAVFESQVRAIKDLDRLFQILERIAKARSLGEIDLG